jgi:RNA 2',3'-cyclic 3'-phosphodiesterase
MSPPRHTDRVRLFVAVALPDAVSDLVAALPRPDVAGLKWTTPAQWHVTLRFLGEASPDEVIPTMEGAFEGLRPNEAPLATLGPAVAWFPGRRVLQVPVAGLEQVAAAVRRVTKPWGTADEPPYAGHLTLARTVGRRRGPAHLAGAPVSAKVGVTEVGLYSSRPGQRGSIYERLVAVPLVTPDAGSGGPT